MKRLRKVGYRRPGYKWSKSIKRFKQTGHFRYVGTKVGKNSYVYGLGHKAGEEWGTKKNIDPNSQQRRYSKNSPSFDEGVYLSKMKRRQESELKRQMASRMK